MMTTKLKTFHRLVKYLIAAAALGWLLLSGNLSIGRLSSLRLDYMFLCLIGILCLNLAFQATRWWCLVRLHGIDIGILKTLKIFWIANFFYIVLPGALGGEFARAYYLARDEPSSRLRGILSIVLDRLLGLYVFFLLAVFAYHTLPSVLKSEAFLRYYYFCNLGIVLSVPLLSVLLVNNRVRRFVIVKVSGQDLHTHGEWTKIIKRKLPWLIAAILASLLASISLVAGFWLAGNVLDHPIDFQIALINIPIIVAANCLPISPGGIGVGESASFAVFNQAGFSGGAELMILVRLVITFLRLPGIILYLRNR